MVAIGVVKISWGLNDEILKLSDVICVAEMSDDTDDASWNWSGNHVRNPMTCDGVMQELRVGIGQITSHFVQIIVMKAEFFAERVTLKTRTTSPESSLKLVMRLIS